MATRELTINDDMKAAIKRINNGDDIDYSQIAVFEARNLNTRPLRRRGGLFANALPMPSLLNEMADYLNASNEGIPFHIMHNTELLNVGKVFQARLDTEQDGATTISSLFYIPREFGDLVTRFNTGVVDQVSVGVQAAKILCSECKYDYLQGDPMAAFFCECENGHVVGTNGVHVELHGMRDWHELSAVDKGASDDARIVSADKSRFTATTREKFYALAAHQNDLQTSLPLVANLSELDLKETPKVDEAKIKAMLEAAIKDHDESKTVELQAQLDTEKTARTAAEARVAELETQLAAAKDGTKEELETKLAASEAEATKAKTYLFEQAKRAQVAANVASPVTPTDLDAAIGLIDASGKNLVNLFQREQPAGTDLAAKVDPSQFAAFTARKK